MGLGVWDVVDKVEIGADFVWQRLMRLSMLWKVIPQGEGGLVVIFRGRWRRITRKLSRVLFELMIKLVIVLYLDVWGLLQFRSLVI